MGSSIAIDGPAGAGKSTIAKIVSKKLGFIYIDTGAMYRAMAVHMIRNGVSGDDSAEIEKNIDSADISIGHENGEQVVYLNGENVNSLLRTEEVSAMASKTSANAKVREKLVELQRKQAKTTDVVMDGRDIGTVVLPDSELKIYLTAGTRVRAERRYKELIEKGETCNIDEIEADIKERDHRDMTRENSPLKKADDAVEVDSSNMTIEEVADRIISLYKEH
ncbi:(d)CMP kinase [Butyrivibrio sp. INlla16]|uniref:(d)CMP kinase n=1 Tax=Butyrivibrio sp. INlla16 TaxID=1520807 RepID=UPI000883D336|nr:(d)CMP kinase [Butyrivibrio sp. INlla16]SDB29037.1 cytidylate kinase [Butyrivibrio sp. INlla16]